MTSFLTVRSKTAVPFALLGATQVTLIAAITLIAVPLPTIQTEFQLTRPELALVSAAYGLSFGGLLLVGGRIADLLGSRRVFVAGLAGFGASSVLGGLAATPELLLGARLAQGVGAAFVAPAAAALVTSLYPDGPRRARAFAVWGTLSVTGAVAGTVLSGLVVAVSSWRSAFLIPAIAAAIVLSGARRLPSAARQRGSRTGILDGGLATAGLVAISYGVLQGEPVPVAAGLLALAGFLTWQARVSQPLLPLRLVAQPRRGAALLVIWLTAAASATSTFLLSLYFQQVQDRTPAAASVAFLPLLLVIAMGPIGGRLLRRYGLRRVTVLGLVLAAAAMALLSRIEISSPYGGVVLAALVLFPIGSGLAFAGATVTGLSDVPAEHSGVAGGVVNTALEVGATVGLALLLALATARTQALAGAGQPLAHATTGGYAAAFGATAVALLLAALAVTVTFWKGDRSMKYHHKVVLVTGGGSGIGRALARAFAGQGATVVVAGRRPDALEQTVTLVAADGGYATAITADVTRPADVDQLVSELVERHGRLDVAVNSAGAITAGPTAQLAHDEWNRMLEVNATGVFLAMKHEIDAMRDGGGGAIVNIGSSIGAHLRLPGLGAYAAAKAAVSALSRTAALEYIRDGIRINVVSPGPFDTPMSLLPGETEGERAARLKEALPIGRVGALDEMTSTVLWLASDEASFVVGHDLVIDGGGAA